MVLPGSPQSGPHRYKLRSTAKTPTEPIDLSAQVDNAADPDDADACTAEEQPLSAEDEPMPSTSKDRPDAEAADPTDAPAAAAEPVASTSTSSDADAADAAAAAAASDHDAPAKKPRLALRRRKAGKKNYIELPPLSPSAPYKRYLTNNGRAGLLDLPQEVVLKICTFLDSHSQLALLPTCRWLNEALKYSNTFWKMICVKEELNGYQCLSVDDEDPDKVGYQGLKMRVQPPADYPRWRKIFAKGLQMRKNIWKSNYEGWRVFANSNMPVVKLTPELDFNNVKSQLGNFPKLFDNDDLKYDWDDKHLVVFHFFRGEGESTVIRLWDISGEPTFVYQVEKGLDCITDKVAVVNNYVAIVPSWPLDANAIVMTLDIRNNMERAGSFIFQDNDKKTAVDQNWEHTQLRVIRNEAMVVCRNPEWHLLVVDLPTCNPLYEVQLTDVATLYDCQQIRSYRHTAMVLFTRKQNENSNVLVTVDVAGSATRIRSYYHCQDVSDVALFTDPEEFYVMKKNGNVVMFDANERTEIVKIANEDPPLAQQEAAAAAAQDGQATQHPYFNEYQLFVNRKEQICIMQSASEVPTGRHIKVYTYSQEKLYTINLDLCKYGMARDESICIYTNGAFLAAADSRKFTIFNVKTGKYHGTIQIPPHLERNKGKEEKDCMFEQTGLSLFIFDEDKLIAVHDYERTFPAVLDIYRFW